jgi:hypothetical protein
MTFAIFTSPPRQASDKPDYEIDSPAIVAWWNAENIKGGSCLVPVHDLAEIIAGEGHDGLEAVLWAMEEASMARVDRRE